jgi:hypothetical protein
LGNPAEALVIVSGLSLITLISFNSMKPEEEFREEFEEGIYCSGV